MSDALWQLGGWTMLHFLWLGAIVAVAGAAVRLVCRRTGPNVRYAVSLVTLLALAASPAIIAARLVLYSPAILVGRDSTSIKVSPSPNNSPSQDGSAMYAPAPVVIDLAHPESANAANVSPADTSPATSALLASPPSSASSITNPSPSPSAPRPRFDLRGRGMTIAIVVAWLPWAWIVGAPITFALLATGLIGSERLRRKSTMLTSGPVADACQRLRIAMRIARRVSVAACDGLVQPVLIGIVRPLILLPASALSGWTPAELEMVLVHELAHVRRWDNLVNLVQRIVESLLFFHPAVWLVSRQVRRDREECCDAAVISQTAQPRAYAELLVAIAAKMQASRPTAFIAASAMADHALTGRIRRILKLEDEPMWVSRRTLLLGLVIPALLAVGLFSASIAAQPADEDSATQPHQETSAAEQVYSTGKINDEGANEAEIAKPDWEDPTLLKQLFTVSDTNPLKKVVYDVSLINQLADQFTDAIDGYRLDPFGLRLQFEWSWLEKGKRIEISAPKDAHGWFRYIIMHWEAAGQGDQSHGTSGEGGPQRIDQANKSGEVKQDLGFQFAMPLGMRRDMAAARHRQLLLARERAVMQDIRDLRSRLNKLASLQNGLLAENVSISLDALPLIEGDAQAPQYQEAARRFSSFQKQLEEISRDPTPDISRTRELARQLRDARKALKTVREESIDYWQQRLKDDPDYMLERVVATIANLRSSIAEKERQWAELKQSRDAQRPLNVPTAELAAQVGWHTSLEQAKAEAVKEGKPLLLYFTKVDSPESRRFEQDVLAIPEVQTLIAEKFIAISIDVEAAAKLAANYSVQQVPEVAVATSDAQFLGFVNKEGPIIFRGGLINGYEASVAAEGEEVLQKNSDKPSAKEDLQPGDEVNIEVVGEFPEAPIDGLFIIEPQGTVALGATYGRVKIAGLSLLEAEKAVTEKLGEILTDVQVQITVPPRRARGEEPESLFAPRRRGGDPMPDGERGLIAGPSADSPEPHRHAIILD